MKAIFKIGFLPYRRPKECVKAVIAVLIAGFCIALSVIAGMLMRYSPSYAAGLVLMDNNGSYDWEGYESTGYLALGQQPVDGTRELAVQKNAPDSYFPYTKQQFLEITEELGAGLVFRQATNYISISSQCGYYDVNSVAGEGMYGLKTREAWRSLRAGDEFGYADCSGVLCVTSEEELKSIGGRVIAGRLPKGEGEIAITKAQLNAFLEYGYYPLTYKMTSYVDMFEDANLSCVDKDTVKRGLKEEIYQAEDMLGKTFLHAYFAFAAPRSYDTRDGSDFFYCNESVVVGVVEYDWEKDMDQRLWGRVDLHEIDYPFENDRLLLAGAVVVGEGSEVFEAKSAASRNVTVSLGYQQGALDSLNTGYASYIILPMPKSSKQAKQYADVALRTKTNPTNLYTFYEEGNAYLLSSLSSLRLYTTEIHMSKDKPTDLDSLSYDNYTLIGVESGYEDGELWFYTTLLVEYSAEGTPIALESTFRQSIGGYDWITRIYNEGTGTKIAVYSLAAASFLFMILFESLCLRSSMQEIGKSIGVLKSLGCSSKRLYVSCLLPVLIMALLSVAFSAPLVFLAQSFVNETMALPIIDMNLYSILFAVLSIVCFLGVGFLSLWQRLKITPIEAIAGREKR